MSLSLRIVLRTVANILLVYAMHTFIPHYFSIMRGGFAAYVLIGVLFSFLNVLVRPVLEILTLPLKLFLSLVATIIVNFFILWITYRIVLMMNPDVILLMINGGLFGWIITSIVLGLGNWAVKAVIR